MHIGCEHTLGQEVVRDGRERNKQRRGSLSCAGTAAGLRHGLQVRLHIDPLPGRRALRARKGQAVAGRVESIESWAPAGQAWPAVTGMHAAMNEAWPAMHNTQSASVEVAVQSSALTPPTAERYKAHR